MMEATRAFVSGTIQGGVDLLIRFYLSIVYFLLIPFAPITEAFIRRRCKKKGDVAFDGKRPWDPQIKDRSIFTRICAYGNAGMAEAYVDGLWDCDDLEEFFTKVLLSGLGMDYYNLYPINKIIYKLSFNLTNRQTRSLTMKPIAKHYNSGNDLFEALCGPSMNYSIAYWPKASSLEEAQTAKMRLVGEKLKLEPGMRVLDLGCGWGALARYLATQYGVQVVGYTLSEEGARFAKAHCQGLNVEIRVKDWRDAVGKFDRITGIEILESVGPANLRGFFQVTNRCLKESGLMLLQLFGNNHSAYHSNDYWVNKHVLPNNTVPRLVEIPAAADGLFVMEDWHNFSYDGYKTSVAMIQNFKAAWPKLSIKCGPRIYRTNIYFYTLWAALYKTRRLQLWQIVFSKDGFPGGYESIR